MSKKEQNSSLKISTEHTGHPQILRKSQNAKRYCYYVIPSASRQQTSVIAPARIPAQDMETLVVQRLLRWLSDKLAVLDALSSAGDDTALAQALLGAATAHCRAWPTLTVEQVREVVRAVVVKITIGVHSIAIQLSKSALRALLLPAAAANNAAHEPEDDLIELNIQARLKRCGRTVRLIVTPAEASPAESSDQQQLINTLAQAQLIGSSNVLPSIDYFVHELDLKAGNQYGFKSTFNPTYPDQSHNRFGWVSPWHFGINQGPIVVMIENYRSGLVWRLMRNCPYLVDGLRRAGFTGGWL